MEDVNGVSCDSVDADETTTVNSIPESDVLIGSQPKDDELSDTIRTEKRVAGPVAKIEVAMQRNNEYIDDDSDDNDSDDDDDDSDDSEDEDLSEEDVSDEDEGDSDEDSDVSSTDDDDDEEDDD